MQADARIQTAVMAVLNTMAECYARRDLEGLLATCAPDPDHVMYGTQADEKRMGLSGIKAQAERDWSQSNAASIEYGWTSISAAGNVAWTAADVAFKLEAGGQKMTLPGRLTAVLERRGDKWLIVQSHFSLPAASPEGQSFPGA